VDSGGAKKSLTVVMALLPFLCRPQATQVTDVNPQFVETGCPVPRESETL
jgi:hypothetical protein